MEPITRDELFMAAAAGEYSGELPEPITRLELYWQKIAQRIDAGSSVSPESINTAIADYLNTHDADIVTETELFNALAGKQAVLDGKVDKITGKGLSEANFTDAEKTKLAGIAAGAEVNVQSDWNQGDDAADDYIKNKPTNLVQDASYVHTDNNFSNAEKAKADGAIQSTEKGAANGVAELNANGKVPTSQLPAYVDDVLSYNSLSDFPTSGDDGKIYIAKDTNLSYRWGSSEYVVISPSLALGSTSSTAYRGDWGAEDRAAIGTLSTLNTTEKSNLVGAINELKTDSDAKQRTLTFDSAPTENSDKLVKSGVIYTALAGKADATATQTALAGKQNALTAGANITIETVNDVLTISATDTTYSAATTSAAGLMSATDKAKLDNVNAGQMVHLSESTVKILTDSPRSLSESLLNYKIIEVRCLRLSKSISGTTYQSWEWARLIKKSSGDFMPAQVIQFVSNDSTSTIKDYEISILSANPTQLALTRDTSGAGLWTSAIIGYK